MEVFFMVADQLYHDDPRKLAEIKACAAATYYMAFRLGEGAATSGDSLSPDAHHLHANMAFFRFPNDPHFYPATAGTKFPADVFPTTFDVIHDTHKTSTHRGSSHQGAHRNPSHTGKPFDVVLLIWHYVTNFPPPPTGPFFPTIRTNDLTYVMQRTAQHDSIRLDPARLTARCMRTGSATMLRNMKNKLLEQQDLEQIRDHGRWTSDVGSRIYAHASPDAEKMVIPPSLYDSGFMTPHYLRWFYMTPAVH